MIELLKTRKVNNRFLCKIAAHEDFVKLVAGIEIYVYRVAEIFTPNK